MITVSVMLVGSTLWLLIKAKPLCYASECNDWLFYDVLWVGLPSARLPAVAMVEYFWAEMLGGTGLVCLPEECHGWANGVEGDFQTWLLQVSGQFCWKSGIASLSLERMLPDPCPSGTLLRASKYPFKLLPLCWISEGSMSIPILHNLRLCFPQCS